MSDPPSPATGSGSHADGDLGPALRAFWQQTAGMLVERGVIPDTQQTPERNLLVDMMGSLARDTHTAALHALAHRWFGAADAAALAALHVRLGPLGEWLTPEWANEPDFVVGASFLFASFCEHPERLHRLLMGSAIFLMQRLSQRQAAAEADIDALAAEIAEAVGRGAAETIAQRVPMPDMLDAPALLQAVNAAALSS